MAHVSSRAAALAAIGAVALALPASASAANIALREATAPDGAAIEVIDFDDTGGEVNRVTVSFSGDFATVRDPAGIINAGGCPRPNSADRSVVRCRLERARRTVHAELGAGNDTIRIGPGTIGATLLGRGGDDVLTGGDGENEITGGAGNDRLTGGPRDDVFDEGRARTGSDRIRGEGGQDAVRYAARTRRIRADLKGDRDDGERGERDRIGSDVEELATGSARDRLTGNSRANILNAGGGRDLVSARGGRDRVLAGPGRDRIIARDRSVDEIDCGRNRDRVRIDDRDYFDNRTAASRCEVVLRRGAAVAVPLGVPSAAQVDAGALADRLRVGCPGDAPPECRGEMRLTAGATEVMEDVAFRTTRGGISASGLTLTAAGERLLRARGRLRVTQVVVSDDRNGTARTRRSPLTLIAGVHD